MIQPTEEPVAEALSILGTDESSFSCSYCDDTASKMGLSIDGQDVSCTSKPGEVPVRWTVTLIQRLGSAPNLTFTCIVWYWTACVPTEFRLAHAPLQL